MASRQKQIHGIRDCLKLSQYLPINIEKIEYGLRYEKASGYFQDELVKDKIANGIIRPIWQGSTISYSFSLTMDDHELIRRQAHEAALAKKDFKTNNIDLRKVEKALNEALSTIKKRKDIIDEVILPDEDELPTGSSRFTHDLYKEETLVSFVHRLYTLFLEEYKTLIEINFPTLKAYFNLYSKMPVHFFVIVEFGNNETPIISLFKCFNDNNKNEVTLCTYQDIAFDTDEILTYKGNNYKVFTSQKTLLPALKWGLLRSLIYEQIKKELPKAFEHLSL